MRFLTWFYSTDNSQQFQPGLLLILLLPPCALFFSDCPEWGADEERPVNGLLIQMSKEKLLCRLHCQLGLSRLKASGFAMNHWHATKARILIVSKAAAVLAQKKCCPFCARVVLLLLGAPGCRSVEMWVHPQSMMQCHEILALVSLKLWKQHSNLSRAIHFGYFPGCCTDAADTAMPYLKRLLVQSYLGIFVRCCQGLVPGVFFTNKITAFCKLIFGHFTARKLNYVIMLVTWEGDQHPNSCGPFSTLFDLMCILWSVA